MEIKDRRMFIEAFRKLMEERKPSDYFLNVLYDSNNTEYFGYALLAFTVLEPEVGRYFFNQVQRQQGRRKNPPPPLEPIERLSDYDNTDPIWMRRLLKDYDGKLDD